MSRILVVEDHVPMRGVIVSILESMGHEVYEAGNGREALRIQQGTPAELLLTDLFMPEMEGLETIQKMRKLYPELPIMAISGGGSHGDPADYLDMAKKFGARRVMQKPFSVQEMIDAVSALGFGPVPKPPAP